MPYCTKCGAALNEDSEVCSACGQRVTAQGAAGFLESAEEVYLGGFTSPNLRKGIFRGYGVYATSQRIIGVKKRAGVIAGAFLGGLVGHYVTKALSKDESAKQIQELDTKKDFEIYKDQISQIEIKKPGTLSMGHIKIISKKKEETKIAMAGKKEFENVKGLLKVFHPNALKVNE